MSDQSTHPQDVPVFRSTEAASHAMTNTHLLVSEFDYYEPDTLEETVALLEEHGDRAHLLAGGTNLLVWMKLEQIAPDCVINIGHVPGLDGVAFLEDGGVEIGARTKIRTLRHTPRLQAEYTALADACAAFGSTQIQMMGTIGGNLCNGSPASDTVPALLALGAELVLVGPDAAQSGDQLQQRVVPLEEFLVGPGEVALQKGELLTAVALPSLPGARGDVGSAFLKISRVAADLAKASAAAVVVREDDRIVDCRLAFGSVAPTVMRAREAEAVLKGRSFTPELALEAGEAASQEVSPIDDVRSTAWYRRQVVKALTHDVVKVAWERAGGKGQEAGGRRQEARGKRQEAGGRRQEAGGRRQEARGRKQEAGGRRQGAGSRRLHVSRSASYDVTLTVNGVPRRLSVRPNELLLNVLRERLHLTGSKYGCGTGECGACTVLLNGQPALACLVLAVAADGSDVLTIEGLERPDGTLDPLQEAFIEHAAFQCGYCTPGMLMMSRQLLEEIPSPDEDDIRDYLKGNRCRCTGFAGIVRAVKSCARNQQED